MEALPEETLPQASEETSVDPGSVDARQAEFRAVHDKAFLGYGLVDLVAPPFKDMERGPWNMRPLNEKEAQKILSSFKTEGILRYHYPICIAVDRTTVPEGSLTKDGNAHDSAPIFELPHEGEPLLIAGQHRRRGLALYREWVHQAVRKLDDDRAQLENSDSKSLKADPSLRSVDEVLSRQKTLKTRVPATRMWLAKIYDKGKHHCGNGNGCGIIEWLNTSGQTF